MVDFGLQAVVLKTDYDILDPITTHIVMAKYADSVVFVAVDFFVSHAGGNVCWPSKNGAPRPHGAKGVQVVSHLDSDVLGNDFSSIMPDIEWYVARQDIGPEFVRKSWSVMGVWCSRSVSSSSSVCRLSSMVTSSSDMYFHSGPHLACVLCSFLGSLKCSGFFTLSSGSGCIDSSEDVVDEDWMRSMNVNHDVRVSQRQDWEWVALTLVNGFMTGLALGGMSGTSEV